MKRRYRLAAGLGGFLLFLMITLLGQPSLGFDVTGKDLSENDIGSTEITYTIDSQQFSNKLYATQPYLSTTHAFDTGFLDKSGKIIVPDVHGKFNYSDWTFHAAKRGLEGGFEIVDYYACVPTMKCRVGITGDVVEDAEGGVGAYIYVDYIPGIHDPTPKLGTPIDTKKLHWVQFVDANDVGKFIDIHPLRNQGETPYYDTHQSASGLHLMNPFRFKRIYVTDTPYRKKTPNGADKEHTWKAELYLVQETAPKTVTVYNGITWGWHNEKKNDQISETPCNSPTNQSKSDNKEDDNNCKATARSGGDPHLVTFDGLKYDLQTVGEFTLIKSNHSAFEVQARQTPINNSGSVSMNSAVAMKVGTDRVALYAQGLPDADTTTPLRVNGKPTTIQGNKLVLKGGGEILKQGSTYVISVPTGEKVLVSLSSSFLNISPIVHDRSGKYNGLLGNVNGKPNDDLQTRGGGNILKVQSTYGDVNKVLNQVGLRLPGALERGEKVYFDQLYKQFANSWRVKQEESLFDYPPGKTTKSYVNPGFPKQYLTLNMLSADQIQKARKACTEANVTQDLMEGCIFDVGFSGFSEFARATAEINGYVNILNQLFPRLNIPTTGQLGSGVIEKVKPKICLPFIGCH